MNEWLIVGLGNPGKKYEKTRHNIGRMVVELFRVRNLFGEWSNNGLAKAQESRGSLKGSQVRLLMPETYMNLSGESIRLFVKSPDDAARLVVVHDEVDLPFGRIKISFDSGAGGHHGVESIIAHTSTKGFVRVRVGICPVDEQGMAKKSSDPDFVVKEFSTNEKEILDDVIQRAMQAVLKIVDKGTEEAMNEFNGTAS